MKWNVGHRSNKHRKYKNFRIDLSFVFQNGVFILRHFLHQYLENVFKYYFLKMVSQDGCFSKYILI
ncbi:MAG TPA: hypothetical protein DCP10_03900 [Bacteroidales bacterium]|nr:hypothetical protein [Bacteroidales bacterium]